MFINDRQLIEKVVTEMSKYMDYMNSSREEDPESPSNLCIDRWRGMLTGLAVGAFEIPNEE